MNSRRIARELAVIIFPQLPKSKDKLESADLSALTIKAVTMLCDYAKQNLADANGLLLRSVEAITAIEIDHPDNSERVEEMLPVAVTTGQLKTQIDLIERALNLVAEALDIPETIVQCQCTSIETQCSKCGKVNKIDLDQSHASNVKSFLVRLLTTYAEHRGQIDEFIKQARAKWKVERMVSIDRDILRLACTEAFFMPDIPINVSISEAVELSHRFADEKAARFINGILADLAEIAAQFRRSGTMPNLQNSGSKDSISSATFQS